MKKHWQSKVVLLCVLPYVGAGVVLQTHWWAVNLPQVAIWAVGLSLLLGAVVLWLRAATGAGALAGVAITASLIFSTATLPYLPWRTALVPVLAVSLLSYGATRLGREKKERLGTAEDRRGRVASQVAANLGVAAMVLYPLAQSAMLESGCFVLNGAAAMALMAVGVAALAEAAGDTVSSEVGQALGGQPWMITTLQRVEAGTDGGISLVGTAAGSLAAALVAAAGTLALGGDWLFFWITVSGGVFGLLFDSLLGATLERKGWLNNDAVNFLSTASAAGFALGLVAWLFRS